MESSVPITSSEFIRSEGDENGFLLRCQLTEDGENDKDISTSHIPESEEAVINEHKGSDSNLPVGHHSYTVTCTVSIAMALPRGVDDDLVTTEDKGHKNLKKVLSSGFLEVPKPHRYYHIEYRLLPDNNEPIKVDLVMFGLVAKVYMENETKVLKQWLDGDQVWLAWSQTVKLNLSRELLVKMPFHKIIFRVWDTKDRVSPKVKYDRLKSFSQWSKPMDRSKEAPDQTGGIKSLVHKLRTMYEKENPRTRTSVKFQRKSKLMDHGWPPLHCVTVGAKLSTLEANDKSPSPEGLNADGSKRQEMEERFNQRGEQCGLKSFNEAIIDQDRRMATFRLTPKQSLDDCTKGQTSTSTLYLKDKSLETSKKKPAFKSPELTTEDAEEICKNGVASVELSSTYLLAGERSLTGCFLTRSGSVCEGFSSITLDQPLMSEQLKAELNPLIITILSASSLPSSPVPFNELRKNCVPVYCQYKFPSMPVHRTKGRHHGPNIYFRDVHVILTGLLNTEVLQEVLRGPAIEIEVHDRDRRAEKPFTIPAIFGTDPDDDKLASAGLVTTRRTAHSNELYNVYGIAKLNLSDLLRGHRCLNLTLPIRRSQRGQWMDIENNDWEVKMLRKADILDNSQEKPMPVGDYIDANSQLRVLVEIARPLSLDPHQSKGCCPFGRIVYAFDCNNASILTKLKSQIVQVNSAAFCLDAPSEEAAQKVLCGYRMNAKNAEDENLNVLTGFYVTDKSLHLFVLEGLKEQAIRQIWETVPMKLEDGRETQFTVLYNSALSFSKRLYDSLDVGLSPVHLCQPLDTILKEPLLYIRDALPYTCLQALLRIKRLFQVKRLDEVVQYDLFPSAKMVLSLKQEFGIDSSSSMESLKVDTKDLQDNLDHHVSQRRIRTPLDNFNKDYLKWKQSQADQGLYTKDFVPANIEEVHKQSSDLQKPKPKLFVAKVEDGQSAHNYSIQKVNSTTLALELMRKEMAQMPNYRFTYSQNYHSLTLDPVDTEAEQKESKVKARAAWRTYNGFIYPGFKSSIESNRHSKCPDQARVEELRKPWRENILHRNILSPTLNRSSWPWSQHHEDFKLYKKPAPFFSPETPISIYLAGESLRQEQLQYASAQYSRWLRKILPDKCSAGSGRVPEFKCHMRRAGLDKLQDLLKDKPMKLSLKRPQKGTRVKMV
ncbi:uncharacterized protein cfap92 [Hoplias malabaricus]|uniref:uncharacterized protein cfap92 n=1 Tax=Hoplias malabaricus TaxID=27720 RepID=UPI003461E3B6